MLAGMTWGDSMHFELHRPKTLAAPGASTGAISGGVARWLPLENKVFEAKGFPLSQVYIMSNQMQRESGGDPNAVNRTDSNARAGHPSVGILQFIPSTFATFADPGFNTNIMDPESQMRAFLNYVPARYGSLPEFAKRGYGAYARGGPVHGSGSGTSDSNFARVSDGEFVSTAKDSRRNRGALNYMAAGGTIRGYATGGQVTVGKAQAGLTGKAEYSPGAQESNVRAALSSIYQVIADLHTALAAKREDVTQAQQKFNSVKASNTEAEVAAQARVTAAHKAASAAAVASAAKIAAAGKLNTDSQQAALATAHRIQDSETSKTSARTRIADAARVAAAQAALDKAEQKNKDRRAAAQAGASKADLAAANRLAAAEAHQALVKKHDDPG
jgi:hypothetical protein